MSATEPSTRPAQPISPATRMGAVHLTVADLDRSLAYYRQAIGLAVIEQSGGQASLGAGGDPLVVLVEQPGARPAPHSTGLFHFALRVPERRDLAGWLAHAARDRVEVSGLSDHFVSEAIYLHDPDQHGIEIYHDRPRASWEGQVERLTTLPLDVSDLLGELPDPERAEFTGLPTGTDMGHVHLQVADISSTVGFVRDVLGFELMAVLGDQAAFLAAGGYHHHIGANTWNSRGAGPPPPGSAALRHATIVLPDRGERDRVAARVADGGQEPQPYMGGLLVHDPSANALLLTADVE
jgi:catechol 2,3-dioxygenase